MNYRFTALVAMLLGGCAAPEAAIQPTVQAPQPVASSPQATDADLQSTAETASSATASPLLSTQVQAQRLRARADAAADRLDWTDAILFYGEAIRAFLDAGDYAAAAETSATLAAHQAREDDPSIAILSFVQAARLYERSGDADAASEQWRQAGWRSARLLSRPTEALAYLDRALELAREHRLELRMMEAQRSRMSVLRTLGRDHDAQDALRECVDLAAAVEHRLTELPSLEQIDALMRLSSHYEDLNQAQESRQRLEHALELAQTQPQRLPRILRRLAYTCEAHQDYDAAARYFQAWVDYGRQADDPVQLTRALQYQAIFLAERGRTPEALRSARAAFDLRIARATTPADKRLALTDWGQALEAAERHKEALDVRRQAADQLDPATTTGERVRILLRLASSHAHLKSPQQALATLLQATEVLDQPGEGRMPRPQEITDLSALLYSTAAESKQFHAAQQGFERLLRACDRFHWSRDERAALVRYLGRVLIRADDPSAAIAVLRREISRYDQGGGARAALVRIELVTTLAQAQLRAGQTLEALATYEQAAADAVENGDVPLMIRCAGGVVWALRSANRLDDAVKRADAALELDDGQPSSATAVGRLLWAKAEALTALGRFEDAQELLRQAQRRWRDADVSGRAIARLRARRAMLFDWMDRPVEAEVQLHRAMRELREMEDAGDRWLELCLHMASIQFELGDYQEAMQWVGEADKLLGNVAYSGSKADAYYALANVVGYVGWRMHTAQLQTPGGEDHEAQAAARLEQAAYYLAMAQADYEQMPEGAPARTRGLYQCVRGRAQMDYARKRYAEAISGLQQAIEMLGDAPESRVERAMCCVGIGLSHNRLGQLEPAAEALERALNLVTRPPADAMSQSMVQFVYGQVQAARGQRPAAAERMMRVLDAGYNAYVSQLPRLTRRERVEFVNRLARSADADVPGLFYTMAFNADRGGAIDARYGLDVALLLKDFATESLRLERRSFGQLDKLPQARARRRDADAPRRLAEARRRLASLALVAAFEVAEGVEPEHQYAVDVFTRELRLEIESLERQVQRRHGAMLSVLALHGPRVQSADVQAALKADDVLLEYVVYAPIDLRTRRYLPPRVGVFVVDRQNVAAVDLGSLDAVEHAVRRFVSMMDLHSYTFSQSTYRSVDAAAERMLAKRGAEVRRLLVDPLARHLADRKRVYVAPDGPVSLLPLEALPTADAKPAALTYLGERQAFIYITSSRDVCRFRQHPATLDGDAVPRATVLGAPDFDATPRQRAEVAHALMHNLPQILPAPARDQDHGDTVVLGGSEIGPFGKDVMQFINQDVPQMLERSGLEVSVYTGPTATAEALMLQKAPRVLVIVTHGWYLPHKLPDLPGIDPAMLRSVLSLAGANRRDLLLDPVRVQVLPRMDWLSGWVNWPWRQMAGSSVTIGSGWLSAYELADIDLAGTEVVILAACLTGRGAAVPGDGISGIRRSMLLSGTDSVLMTMWSVPTAPTLRQVEAFLGQPWLGGGEGAGRLSRHQAFRQSQLAAIEHARRQFKTGHPFFWAGLVYVGDPGDTHQPVP